MYLSTNTTFSLGHPRCVAVKNSESNLKKNSFYFDRKIKKNKKIYFTFYEYLKFKNKFWFL